MSPNGAFDRNLESWLTAEAPKTAPPGLHDGVMERARGAHQRPAWLVAVRGGTIGGPALVAERPGIRGAWLLVALALVLAALMIAIAGGAFRSPTDPRSAATALEDLGASGVLDTGVTYTSSVFEPRVTFKLATRDGLLDTYGQVPDWCSPVNMEAPLQTGPRVIVLSHPKGCDDELRLIRPYAVDCGTPDAHPDAAALAAVLLAGPGVTSARELGSLQAPGSRLFLHAYNARGIRIGPPHPAQPDGTAPGPGPCRLIPDPGSSDHPVDLRQDALLVLIDVRGELVILQATSGYGLEEHLLSRIYDIAFP